MVDLANTTNIWSYISLELDKVGITVEPEVVDALVAQDSQDHVDRLFVRIERYTKILCGKNFLD